MHLDANAAAADRFLPVNRIKPHTCFKGPIESGCMKMAVVGFGKQPGAALVHSCGPIEMRDRLLDGMRRAALRPAGCSAASGRSSRPPAMSCASRGSGPTTSARELEHELTEYARALVPALPFDEIDVLIIEQGGKDISGTTIDPNVTGRFWVHGSRRPPRSPRVSAIVLLDLTEVSGGNALGIGFADFIPASLANQLDFRKTYINCFTAGPAGMRRSRDADGAPRRGVVHQGCAVDVRSRPDEPKRVVRIRSTLHLTRCRVSDALLP